MKTTLKEYTVQEVCEGFVYNELEGKGLFGLNGQLTIQPEYQRNYIYNDGKRCRRYRIRAERLSAGAYLFQQSR